MSSSFDWIRKALALSVGLAAFAYAALAAANLNLCLEVKTDRADRAGFEKLVRSEIGRHRSHVLVDSGCDSRLSAELFHLGATRYLTLRIDGEIPIRYPVPSDNDLELRLVDGLSRVLGNDPAYLAEDPSRLSAVERAGRSVLVRGSNSYRLGVFEAIARTDTGVAFAPGVALELARGADHFSVFIRAAVAGSPGELHAGQRRLRLFGDTALGLSYEASARANTSAYAAAGASLTLMHFEGRLTPDEPSSAERVDALGPTAQLRIGLRFLRAFDFDCDIFAILVLPLFATKSPDSVLFGERGIYTPLLQTGVAVGF